MIGARELDRLRRDTGFNANFLEKAYHLTEVLHAISEIPALSENLTLKGGTAMNFTYLDVPRLSVDLDFNFTGAIPKEEMLALRPVVSDDVSLLADFGYTVVKKPSSYIMDRFLLKYETLAGLKDSIKIEVNFLNRVPIIKKVKRDFNHFFGAIPKFRVDTYQVEELCAMKAHALFDRLYARDLFDMYNLSKLELKKEVTRKLMVLYILLSEKSIQPELLIPRVREYPETGLREKLQPFLRIEADETGFDALKVKEDTASFLESILKPTDAEGEYVKLFNKGTLNLDLLFGSLSYNPDAPKSPSLAHALAKGRQSKY